MRLAIRPKIWSHRIGNPTPHNDRLPALQHVRERDHRRHINRTAWAGQRNADLRAVQKPALDANQTRRRHLSQLHHLRCARIHHFGATGQTPPGPERHDMSYFYGRALTRSIIATIIIGAWIIWYGGPSWACRRSSARTATRQRT